MRRRQPLSLLDLRIPILHVLVAALAVLVGIPSRSLAQSADVLVLEVMRARPAGDDMACDDRTTISGFVNGALRSQTLEEAIVATPRRGRGVIDLDSGYRELVRVNGKPLASNRADGSTANRTDGGAWLGSTSGWVFSARNSFDFKTAGLEMLKGAADKLLVLQFERKKGSAASWFVPDSGKLWIHPVSKRIFRFEIEDNDLTPMLAREARRTIVEDFGSFSIDGEERWLVKARTLDLYPNTSMQKNFTKTHSEYSNCRRFSVSSAIKPVR
jgi:hypothetical protein